MVEAVMVEARDEEVFVIRHRGSSRQRGTHTGKRSFDLGIR